jgi:hypothetical protein
MMNEDITNYPLSWPFSQPRTKPHERKRAQFKTQGSSLYGASRKHTIAEGARALGQEIRRMGGREMIISTNLKVKADGLPYSNQRKPDDPGVAVYFKWKKQDIVFACDKWLDIEDNLWAIFKHIEALRGQERWGVGSLDQAFAGYAALPDPNQRSWWDVLNIRPDASDEEIRQAYFTRARYYHPDNKETGNQEMFIQVQSAYELAQGRKK